MGLMRQSDGSTGNQAFCQEGATPMPNSQFKMRPRFLTDLHHIRVIYYDVNDPFWGRKLIDKVAEDILSAIKNPKEAIFKSEEEG